MIHSDIYAQNDLQVLEDNKRVPNKVDQGRRASKQLFWTPNKGVFSHTTAAEYWGQFPYPTNSTNNYILSFFIPSESLRKIGKGAEISSICGAFQNSILDVALSDLKMKDETAEAEPTSLFP
ncbi:hypothetical protein OPQ81_003306 [Rhizoctonia solani]|nr:hypothetical protein OPQ81_003306 [Rhizoctonia solani]